MHLAALRPTKDVRTYFFVHNILYVYVLLYKTLHSHMYCTPFWAVVAAVISAPRACSLLVEMYAYKRDADIHTGMLYI